MTGQIVVMFDDVYPPFVAEPDRHPGNRLDNCTHAPSRSCRARLRPLCAWGDGVASEGFGAARSRHGRQATAPDRLRPSVYVNPLQREHRAGSPVFSTGSHTSVTSAP